MDTPSLRPTGTRAGAPTLPRMLRTRAAAEVLDLAPQTLRKWRITGRGPRWTRSADGIIRYSLSDLMTWAGGGAGAEAGR